MGFVYWSLNADGDWSTAADWGNAALPTSADSVTISSSTLHTVFHGIGSDTIASLLVGNDMFAITGGALRILGGATFLNGLTVAGGLLSFGAAAKITGGLSETGGTLVIAGGAAITGAASLLGGTLTGSGAMTVSGGVTLGTVSILGGVRLLNAHTVNQTGNVTLGDATAINAAIVNEKGATYNIANPVGIVSGAATARLSNAGVLATLAGTGASTIGVSAASTGTLAIGQGSTLIFAGPQTSLAGRITGAGTLAIVGGTASIAKGTTLAVAALEVFNLANVAPADLIFGQSTTLTAGYTQFGASTLDLGTSTLTITGATQFSQSLGTPLIIGSGVLITAGATTATAQAGLSAITIGGSVSWRNAGTVTIGGTLTIGSSAAVAASVTNAATGLFNLAGADAILNGSTPASSFTNAGTLAMTATGSVISTFGLDVVDSGIVTVASGDVLEFDGGANSFAGSLRGAGTVGLAGAGSSHIAAGTTIAVATLAIYGNGTSVTFDGNDTVAGRFAQLSRSTTTLTAGHTLTLAGAAAFTESFGTVTLAGAGTLVTRGATALTANPGLVNLVVGDGVVWHNSGTVSAAGTLVIGNSNAAAATVINDATGVFNLAGVAGIATASGPASRFVNAGRLAMTAGGGTDTVTIGVTSTGAVAVVSGDVLEFDGPANSFAGSIAGAGTVAFAGGASSTIAAGTAITVATLAVYTNASALGFAGDESFAGSFAQRGRTTVTLTGHTLTLTGAVAFSEFFGTPTLTGSGVLATTGTTTIAAAPNLVGLVLGGSVAWRNAGAVTLTGTLTLGDSTLLAASIGNAAAGVFNLVAGDGIANGSTALSSFANAGTVRQSVGSGTTTIAVGFTNSGHVTVSAGTLAFAASVSNTGTLLASGAALSFAGTLSGTGVIDLQAGGSASFSAPVAAGQTLDFRDATGSATIALTAPTSFAATIAGFVKGDTIDLKGVSGATARFAGGVLTFKTGATVVATLKFSNAPHFTFASDGGTGTLIGDPPISAATIGLRQAYFTNVGAAAETIAVSQDGAPGVGTLAIGGFSTAHADVLDLRALLAGTAAAQHAALLGHFLTAHAAGADTTLLFDHTGHGGGTAVAVLEGVTTSVADLMAHHALRV